MKTEAQIVLLLILQSTKLWLHCGYEGATVARMLQAIDQFLISTTLLQHCAGDNGITRSGSYTWWRWRLPIITLDSCNYSSVFCVMCCESEFSAVTVIPAASLIITACAYVRWNRFLKALLHCYIMWCHILLFAGNHKNNPAVLIKTIKVKNWSGLCLLWVIFTLQEKT